MNAPSLSSTPGAEESRCHAHPDQPALGVCTRCGVFVCAQDYRLVHDKPYCETCAVRPDVDYLEGFRLQHWGKRDGWAWLVGVGAIANLLGGLVLLAGETELLLLALFLLASSVVGACFWMGQPWARLAYVFVPIVSIIIGVTTEGPLAIGRGLVPIAIAVAIFNDTRNKLFFKEEVSPEALRKAWDLYKNNTVARAGFFLGLLGLLLPFIGLIALVCSIIGLRRVNPNAHPPIGRKGQAIAGIVLGTVGCLLWGGVLAVALLS
jgi:hypothetical protein